MKAQHDTSQSFGFFADGFAPERAMPEDLARESDLARSLGCEVVARYNKFLQRTTTAIVLPANVRAIELSTPYHRNPPALIHRSHNDGSPWRCTNFYATPEGSDLPFEPSGHTVHDSAQAALNEARAEGCRITGILFEERSLDRRVETLGENQHVAC